MMAFIQHLHLQYRLWIAELNADINVLRIFEDCLADLQAITGTIDATHQIDIYRKQFVESRKKMDELRHEMYINKMKLAAVAKTPDASTKKY